MNSKHLLVFLLLGGLLAACSPVTERPAVEVAGDAPGKTADAISPMLPATPTPKQRLIQPSVQPGSTALSLESARRSSYARQTIGAAIAPPLPAPTADVDRERYAEFESSGIQAVADHPVSTFSIDVDTGSYANVRRILQEGRLPPRDAVRVEELMNYFQYGDSAPNSRDQPFRVSAEMAPTPWNSDTHLLRVELKAWAMPEAELPPSNLVFLLDVSGSMNSHDKLPLLRRSIKLLTRRMDSEDRVSIVVYAGAAGVVLEPTAGNEQAKIEAALDELTAGGSTHGSAGIRLAYAKAREGFLEGGINRVILATDGDFNVGTVDQRALLDLVERERRAGIALTTLGFGRGNYNESMMEQLADHGDGNHAYIDNLLEAQKVLVEQIGGTLMTIAKDVKIQVEFNPARVAEYRLIGYENRALRREDFTNDRVDAGELGAGHSVVALYEVGLADGRGNRLESLRYGGSTKTVGNARNDELAFVRLRYKLPEQSTSRLLELPVTDALRVDRIGQAGNDFRFAAAVAAFGQQLRHSPYLEDFGYDGIIDLARDSRGADDQGYRSDFLRLVHLAKSLDAEPMNMSRNDTGGDDGNG